MNIIEVIKKDLADNYRSGDDEVIKEYIKLYTKIACSTSNRSEDDDSLVPYIYIAVKEAYLRRGDEGNISSSESGRSRSYIDIEEKLRKDCMSIRRGNF